MADYSVVTLDDIEPSHGVFKAVRAALGGTAFGINVLELPAGFENYPEHSHSEDQQEEVYTALSGSGEIDIEGERIALQPGTFVRVAPGTNRRIVPGPEGVHVLAVGCKAGSYTA
jgi:uncharacterized cupin superfamily protein